MSWFKGHKVPEVKVEGNRFTIIPPEDEVIDVTPQRTQQQLAVRQVETLERPMPRVGSIPSHSWGA
jgi:hypothetical protein